MALQTPVRAATATPNYYRTYTQPPIQRIAPNVTDDYERMLLPFFDVLPHVYVQGGTPTQRPTTGWCSPFGVEFTLR